MDCLEKLGHTCLPSQGAFDSPLKGTRVTDEQYAFCKWVWSDSYTHTFADLLVWQNNLDVEPIVAGNPATVTHL